ncbi:hypothetical protein BCF53_102128 [Reinekea marinisedimentorum]|uniref:HicA-like toxin of HicAB toxin-antitoxin system n=1 Tax=Reinekea marinisedimentorum TaxID=230495 RepID=A0A4R3IAV1_9GAMM|nr:hypothetical protein BCF53_102128 [Reinekea marinisedimentorum]
MKYSSDKDINHLVRGLVADGCVYKPCKKHGKLYSGAGYLITIVPCTPSDKRALKNFLARLRQRGYALHTCLTNPAQTNKQPNF